MGETIIRGNQNTTKLINTLKNSGMQYPVLTKEQERKMIEDNRGNRDRMNFLLFMHNVRTVFSQAKAYVSKTDDFDSLVQNGMLGLAEAVRRFDPDRDIKFCTYANTWVHKYLSMPYYTSQFKIDMNTVSLSSPAAASRDCDGTLTAEDTLENSVQDHIDPATQQVIYSIEHELQKLEQEEICTRLYEWVDADSSLSSVDKAVFKDIFIENEKTRNIAEKYRMDVSDVSEIKKRVLAKCKGLLADRYNVTSYDDVGGAE